MERDDPEPIINPANVIQPTTPQRFPYLREKWSRAKEKCSRVKEK